MESIGLRGLCSISIVDRESRNKAYYISSG
jgi:hypothetical protein